MPHFSSDLAETGTSDRQWFASTHWSVVLSAGERDSLQASESLEKLCRTYWPPLYSFVRRQGYRTEDAQDLTQAFFAKLLEKNFWARADPQKGRFRSFLLTALNQYLADQRDRARTVKRGGGVPAISLDQEILDEQFLQPGAQNLSAEQQFERQWASAVLSKARTRLCEECVASGKSELYDAVNLLGDRQEAAVTYVEMSGQLGMSVSAIKSAVSRLRQRYGELVREEVTQTVSSPAEVDAEITYLLSVIGG
jgi:RNA polymerase sigma factor (sigma-70 family)